MQVKESAFTPQRQNSFLNLLITIAICAGIAWLVIRACSAATDSKIELPSISKPQATAVVTPETRRVYTSDGKTEVQMCTQVGGDCASIEPGPTPEYGRKTQDSGAVVKTNKVCVDDSCVTVTTHERGEGRTTPPGWKWASCPEGQHVFTTAKGGIFCQ